MLSYERSMMADAKSPHVVSLLITLDPELLLDVHVMLMWNFDPLLPSMGSCLPVVLLSFMMSTLAKVLLCAAKNQ